MVDHDLAVIVDVDLDLIALVDDVVDDLAAGTDDFSDLIGRDREGDHLRSVLADFRSRFSDRSRHVVEDLHSSLMCLSQSFLEDLSGDSLALDVHLQSGDAFSGSGDLEVHVTVVVFHALDIRQDGIVFSGRDQTHCHTGNRSLDRNAGSHQRHGTGTDRSLGAGTVGFQNFRDRSDRIREFLFARQYLQQSSFTQCTVTDLTTARAAHSASLTDGVWREVVVMHETFLFDISQIVDDLVVP